MKKREKKHKKISPVKLYSALLCVFLFLGFIANGITYTWLIGNGSIIEYIENYCEENVLPKNQDISIISNDENYFYEFHKNNQEPIKVFQISDLHLGCGFLTRKTDELTVNQVIEAVKTVNPDLIIVTGDALSPIYVTSGTRDSSIQLKALIALMKKIGLPWSFCFGNHDMSGTLSKDKISEVLENAENCLYYRGDKQINGHGNFYIKLYHQNNLSSSIILLDTGGGSFLGYEGVHENQVKWYESTVLTLKTELTTANIQSLLYVHIPLAEYETAWDLAQKGSDKVELIFGDKKESISAGKQAGLYDKIVELDYTKWVFCGHDHYNDFSVLIKEHNIRLTYGMAFDYSAYPSSKHNTFHRGGTLAEVSSDGKVEIFQATQDNDYIIER